MKEVPKPRRRWVPILALSCCLAVAAASAWVGRSLHRVRQRDEALTRVELEGGSVVMFSAAVHKQAGATGSLPGLWQLLGAKPVAWVLLPDAEYDRESASAQLGQLFPEARIARLSQAPRVVR